MITFKLNLILSGNVTHITWFTLLVRGEGGGGTSTSKVSRGGMEEGFSYLLADYKLHHTDCLYMEDSTAHNMRE